MDNMDSLSSFYDLFESGSPKPNQQGVPKSQLVGEEGLPLLADLDPAAELSLDIQALINSDADTQKNTEPSEELFPELASYQVQDTLVQQDQSCGKLTDYIQDQGGEPMPQEASSQATHNSDGCQVLTVRAEDLIALGLGPDTGEFSFIKIEPSQEPLSLHQVDGTEQLVSTTSTADQPKTSVKDARKSAGNKGATKRRHSEKGSQEYLDKRARNNVAVRKSRDKAKVRQKETEERVQELVDQNEQLQRKVDLLSKELTVLKGLFLNVGADVPKGLGELLKG